MASSATTLRQIKAKVTSDPSQKVRIVAKIRNFTDLESDCTNSSSNPWIHVHKPKGESSDNVTISFSDQPTTSRKESYEVDYCYEQYEDNCLIFSREIKPLIAGLFDGHSASVIAYGARGSGKTYTIQGCDENLGLAAMAMNQILLKAEEYGKSVSISSYDVCQDHVYDMLDPQRQEVLVFENGRGIQLKGLSQVPVRSISEFHKLYFNKLSSHKVRHKIPTEVTCRSHKGLMVHVTSCENLKTQLVAKINFVDLAGYEDVRRKTVDGLNLVDSTRLNKSIYALHNVVHALNAGESHVPYRESKLTRMLQDSLGGENRILMVACLNPTFCQDTICMINLASRSHQCINRASTDSAKKSRCSKRPVFSSSLSKISKSSSVTGNAKKQAGCRGYNFEKKTNNTASAAGRRKLFDEANRLAVPEQANSESNNASSTYCLLPKDDKNLPMESSCDTLRAIVPLEEDENLLKESSCDTLKAILSLEEETFIPIALEGPVPITTMDASLFSNDSNLKITSTLNDGISKLNVLKKGLEVEKENLSNKCESPPISARLRELSNNLKSLHNSTPLLEKLLEDKCSSNLNFQVSTNVVEPKTPVVKQNLTFYYKIEPSNINNPLEVLNIPSSGMKKSLVEGHLKFLNSANKEELKRLKGIGEKRATQILELREMTPEPFKALEDLKEIGLSAKQIKGMMQRVASDIFSELDS